MSHPIGQRNLLFGILAMQKSIINLDLFVASMKTWVELKSKGLAQILREQNALSENHHALLEELVDDHLARHGNDLEKSLAAVCLIGEPRQALEAIADDDLQAGLKQVSVALIEEPVEIVEEVIEEIPEATLAPVEPKQSRPKKRQGVPAWVLIAGGLAVGVVVAVLMAAAASVAVVVMLLNRNADRDAQVKLDAAANPPMVAAPIKEAIAEKPVVKPPIKEIEPEKIVVQLPKEMPPPVAATEGFVPLFNGKDLTGWKPHQQMPGDWRVVNGILTGFATARGTGRLYTEKTQPRDFHLRVEARLGENAMGNICFRSAGDWRVGFESAFSISAAGKFNAGGLTLQNLNSSRGFPRLARPPIMAGEWFTLEVIASGSRVIIKVNGTTTIDSVDSALMEAGLIGLTQHNNLPVEFRRIEIKELPPVADVLPIAKAEGPPVYIRQLPLQAEHACLTADGLRVVYTTGVAGAFAYLEAPAFNVAKLVTANTVLTPLVPLASSPDGQRMAFTADTPGGPKVFVWHWGSNSIEKALPFDKLAVSGAFSPDGKYLVTYANRIVSGKPPEPWMCVHAIDTGMARIQRKIDGEPSFFGFTPDSRLMFFAVKGEDTARSWQIATGGTGVIPFPAIAKKHSFSRDFSQFSYIENPNHLQVAYVAGLRMRGNLKPKVGTLEFHSVTFSHDNRYLLVGFEDAEQRPNLVGKAVLIDQVDGGKSVGTINGLKGIPERIELGANGIGLLQGQNLRPRLYRFPIGPGAAFVKIDGPPPPPTPGFVQLFNGKDLTGWKADRFAPGNWRVENGALVSTLLGKIPGRLYTERPQPRDFHLRVEARVSDQGSAAVLFRCPDGTILGYEAKLNSTVDSVPKTGTLYAHIPGRGAPVFVQKQMMVPPDQWFTLEIIAEGERLTVKVDGRTTVNIVDRHHVPASAHVALMQNSVSKVEFRRIEIKEIAGIAPPPAVFAPADGFVPLFNGQDFTGWRATATQPQQGEWRVINGILRATGRNVGPLYTPRDDYGDFHLRVEARINDQGAASLAFRYPYGPDDLEKRRIAGYAVRITGHPNELKTGTLATYEKFNFRQVAARELMAPGEWFTLEVIAQGNRVTTKVNGQIAVNMLNPKTDLKGGRLALGFSPSNRETVVEYRKIEIKEFKAVAAPPLPPPERPFGEFVSLLNGKDLSGWRVDGADGWKLGPDGVLIGQGPDTALITKRIDYRGFIAKVELSASADIEAFFGLRETPGPNGKVLGLSSRLKGNGKSVRAGYSATDGSPLESGHKPVDVEPGEKILIEFHVKRDEMRIYTNGQWTSTAGYAPDRYPSGAIGLHIAKGTVHIKKFEISAEIPADAVAPPIAPPIVKEVIAAREFVLLFNGKDLTGWQPHAKRPGNWRVENGVLIGSAPIGGALYTTRGDYQDFHLRAETRINDKGFGRVFVRATYDPTKIPFKVVGYEALINQRPIGAKTGTLTATSPITAITTPGKDEPTQPGEWFVLEIVAKGDLVTVLMNGKAVAEFADAKRQFARSGHIALQQDANALIEFRKVEIKDLSAQPVLPVKPLPVKPIDPPLDKGGKAGFPATFNAGSLGKWRIDGNELVQDVAKPNASIFFGDPKWTDYDFTVWAMRTEGDDQFGLWFRRAGDNDSYLFGLGGQKNSTHLAARVKGGAYFQRSLLAAKDNPVENGRWHFAKVSVRGDKAECYLDGVKLFEFTADKLAAGSVGLRTWSSAYRFKNVKVTAPDGKVLLEGLPDVPAR